MRVAVTMRATNRIPPTLPATLENLARAGVGRVSIAFGAQGLALPNVNAVVALRMAIAERPDWIVFLEDDLDFISDFLGSVERWLADVAVPSVRAYALGSFYGESVKRAWARGERGVACQAANFYGSQAVALRLVDAVDFADWLELNLSQPNANADQIGRQFDLRLAVWHQLREPTSPMLFSVPSFVNHIGTVSSISNRDDHITGECRGFGGREYVYQSEGTSTERGETIGG